MVHEGIEPDGDDGGVRHADERADGERDEQPARGRSAGGVAGFDGVARRRGGDGACSHPRRRHGGYGRSGMRGPEGITGPAVLAKFSWLTRPAICAATSRNTPPTVLSGAAAISG